MLITEYQKFIAENEDILFKDAYYIGVAIIEGKKTLVFIILKNIDTSRRQ